MTDHILVLNVGSSSIKFAAYRAAEDGPPTLSGSITGVGRAPVMKVKLADGGETPPPPSMAAEDPTETLIDRLVEWLETALTDLRLVAAGHRVVHGGQRYADPVLVDDEVLAVLETFRPLAPNHQPGNLAGVREVARMRPDLPQVACFDTAFHRTQPRLAQLFALPRALSDEGVLRYGFHGLSYEHIAAELPRRAAEDAEGRVVVAHLGAGASACAMRGRRSTATSMGFTALDGLMMGKRPGLLDPGVVLHLLTEKGMSAPEVAKLLNNQCGLLGVSGISDDLRDLEASDDPRAAEAIDLFAYRAIQVIGGLAATLGGLDAIVFTAGVGEHSARMRAKIAEGFEWLGLWLDPEANADHATLISTPESAVRAYVIPTDEEGVIARHTRRLTHFAA